MFARSGRLPSVIRSLCYSYMRTAPGNRAGCSCVRSSVSTVAKSSETGFTYGFCVVNRLIWQLAWQSSSSAIGALVVALIALGPTVQRLITTCIAAVLPTATASAALTCRNRRHGRVRQLCCATCHPHCKRDDAEHFLRRRKAQCLLRGEAWRARGACRGIGGNRCVDNGDARRGGRKITTGVGERVLGPRRHVSGRRRGRRGGGGRRSPNSGKPPRRARTSSRRRLRAR